MSGGEKPVTDTLEEVYTIDVDDLVYDGEKKLSAMMCDSANDYFLLLVVNSNWFQILWSYMLLLKSPL